MTHSDPKNSMPPPDPAPPPAGACVPVDHPIANPPRQAGLAGSDQGSNTRESDRTLQMMQKRAPQNC